MGKISLDWTIFERTDPVTGTSSKIIRNGNTRQTSRGLKNFQNCVAEQMRGRNFTVPGDPRASSIAVRQAFAEAANQCQRS